MKITIFLAAAAIAAVFCAAAAKNRIGGNANKPVRFIGPEQADSTHDGGLRWSVGAKSWQALRANRSRPELADDFGWTYNHAPMLAYWRSRFWVEYLSAPVHENRGKIEEVEETIR